MNKAPTPHALARKRDLWWQLTIRAIEIRHRGSLLGLLWSVLNPLLMLALYFVVFSYIFKNHFRGEPPSYFALGLFLGLTLYHAVGETLATSPGLIVSQPNFVKKVVFPLELLPVAQLGAVWFHALISLTLLLTGLAVFGPGLTLAGLAWLPAILAPIVLLTLGVGWLVSAFGVYLRDISQIMSPLTQILLWTSAVFNTSEAVRKVPLVWSFLKWNPLLHSIDLARDALLWHEPVDIRRLAYTYLCGAICFLFGRWVFRQLQPGFADVI